MEILGFLVASVSLYWFGVVTGKHAILGLIHKKTRQNIDRQEELIKIGTASAVQSFDELSHATECLLEINNTILENYWKPF